MAEQIDWDAEVDTPATIAIVGAGPCGVEAGLYARFLGYAVELFDHQKVGDSILNWGDRLMPAPWRELASSLGLAAIEAHEHPMPDLDKIPTCRDYVEQYLLPIARCDLLYNSVNIKTAVKSVSRIGCDERDSISQANRAEQEFRLLVSSSQRGEHSQIFDLVLDCTGGQSLRRGLASGGGLPIGWSSLAPRVDLGKRRILSKNSERFAGKKILLFGNDSSAAGNAVELYSLRELNTQFFWVIPKRLKTSDRLLDLPVTPDILSPDEALRAEQIYRQADSNTVVAMSAWGIEAIAERDGKLLVSLQTTEEATLDVLVDCVIHCGACRSGASYEHNLRLLNTSPDAVLQAEPHFYLLGDRAALSASPEQGYQPLNFPEFREQIRRVFCMVGGRAGLNLYETVKPIGMSPDSR